MKKITANDITLDLKRQATAEKQTFGQHLQMLADQGELDASIYNPDAKTVSGEGVPAWKQLMVNAGINPKDRSAATVNDAFFRDEKNRVLFPLYIEERYREQGREGRNGLSLADVVSDTVQVDNSVVQTQLLSFADSEDADLGRVSEGGEYPELTITQGDEVVRLFKYGGRLSASLEALLMASLGTFDRWLLKIGRQADRNKIRKALAVLKNGDGNNNAAPNINAASSTLTHADLVALLVAAEGYGADPSVITGDATGMGLLLNLDNVANAAATGNAAGLQDNGNFPVVYGMAPKLPPQRSVLQGTRQLMAIDSAAALTMYTNPSFDLVRYEDIIKRDLRVVQISEMIGFSKPDQGAAITLTVPQ